MEWRERERERERENERERDSLASFYRGTDRPTTAAIEKSFPLSPRLSPMRRRRDCGNGRRPDQRRETTHHHHSVSSEMEGWRDVGSPFSPRIYWITRRRPLRRSYVGKGCKLHPKSRMGGGREKRERCFFFGENFFCVRLLTTYLQGGALHKKETAAAEEKATSK